MLSNNGDGEISWLLVHIRLNRCLRRCVGMQSCWCVGMHLIITPQKTIFTTKHFVRFYISYSVFLNLCYNNEPLFPRARHLQTRRRIRNSIVNSSASAATGFFHFLPRPFCSHSCVHFAWHPDWSLTGDELAPSKAALQSSAASSRSRRLSGASPVTSPIDSGPPASPRGAVQAAAMETGPVS